MVSERTNDAIIEVADDAIAPQDRQDAAEDADSALGTGGCDDFSSCSPMNNQCDIERV